MRRHSGCRKDIVTIIQTQISGYDRPAQTAKRLVVEIIFRRYAHQHVDKADMICNGDRRSVGPVRAKRVGDAL